MCSILKISLSAQKFSNFILVQRHQKSVELRNRILQLLLQTCVKYANMEGICRASFICRILSVFSTLKFCTIQYILNATYVHIGIYAM